MPRPNFEKLFPDDHKRVGTTSTRLIVRLKSEDRDEDAWMRMQNLYGRLVLDWCKRRNVPKNDRIDVMQDIFVAVSKGIQKFRWGVPGQTFRGWLKAIAHTKIVDKYRDNKNLPQLFSDTHLDDLIAGLTSTDLTETEEEAETDRVQLLRQALKIIRNDFEPQTWEAFELTTMQDLTSTEAAAKLGTNAANVRKAKQRILNRLREFEELLR